MMRCLYLALYFAAAIASSRADTDDVLLLTMGHSDRNVVLHWKVPEARLEATAWRDEHREIPLSVKRAVEIARAAVPSTGRTRWHLNAVALMQPLERRRGWFFYMVNFEDDNRQTEVVLLLDGTVVKPTETPQT